MLIVGILAAHIGDGMRVAETRQGIDVRIGIVADELAVT